MDENKNSQNGGTGPLANGWSRNKKQNGSNSRDSSSMSDAFVAAEVDDDDETEDEYCVYTYKGDSRQNQHLADLPLSFFKFDPSESQPGPSSHSVENSKGPGGTVNGIHNGVLRLHNSENIGQAAIGQAAGVSAGASGDIFSPDMDFLEMDFDPGGNGEEDEEDRISELDEEPEPELMVETSEKRNEIEPSFQRKRNASGDSSNTVNACTEDSTGDVITSVWSRIGNHATQTSNYNTTKPLLTSSTLLSSRHSERSTPVERNAHSEQPHCSKSFLIPKTGPVSSVGMNTNENQGCATDLTAVSSSVHEHQITLRLVKSSTLPELGRCKEGNTAEGHLSLSARSSTISNSAPLFSEEPHYTAFINTSKYSKDSVELEVGGVMIWTITFALEKSINQIGTSACGATAILNIMRALGCPETTPDIMNQSVKTRLRAEDADLPEYLFSRWDAGATHEDLISGIYQASKGSVYGRLFHPKENICSESFSKWLLNWICKGAVPVATRNLQVQPCSSEEIPDSWHHQMIFGVSPQGIFLTNPIECVPVSYILPQITSPSVLLVRRQDVILRKGLRTDLRKLARHPDPRWNEMNVLGQVANMLLEEMPVFNGSSVAKRVRSSHILIPARYISGIILFVKRESPSYQLLLNSPDL